MQHYWLGALGSFKGVNFSEVHLKAAPLFGEAPAECSSQCGGSWECGAFIRDRYFQRLGTGSGLARKRLGPQLYWLASEPADSEVRNEGACVFRLRRVGAFSDRIGWSASSRWWLTAGLHARGKQPARYPLFRATPHFLSGESWRNNALRCHTFGLSIIRLCSRPRNARLDAPHPPPAEPAMME